jgi:ABC-type transporter Mla subunit MlaD
LEATVAIKLTKKQQRIQAQFVEKLEEAQNELQSEVHDFNEARNDLFEGVQEAFQAYQEAIQTYNAEVEDLINQGIDEKVCAYNELVQEANGWIEETSSDFQNQFDEKSERWQESEKGDLAADYINSFEIVLEEVEMPTLEPAEEPDITEPAEEIEVEFSEGYEALSELVVSPGEM